MLNTFGRVTVAWMLDTGRRLLGLLAPAEEKPYPSGPVKAPYIEHSLGKLILINCLVLLSASSHLSYGSTNIEGHHGNVLGLAFSNILSLCVTRVISVLDPRVSLQIAAVISALTLVVRVIWTSTLWVGGTNYVSYQVMLNQVYFWCLGATGDSIWLMYSLTWFSSVGSVLTPRLSRAITDFTRMSELNTALLLGLVANCVAFAVSTMFPPTPCRVYLPHGSVVSSFSPRERRRYWQLRTTDKLCSTAYHRLLAFSGIVHLLFSASWQSYNTRITLGQFQQPTDDIVRKLHHVAPLCSVNVLPLIHLTEGLTSDYIIGIGCVVCTSLVISLLPMFSPFQAMFTSIALSFMRPLIYPTLFLLLLDNFGFRNLDTLYFGVLISGSLGMYIGGGALWQLGSGFGIYPVFLSLSAVAIVEIITIIPPPNALQRERPLPWSALCLHSVHNHRVINALADSYTVTVNKMSVPQAPRYIPGHLLLSRTGGF